MASENQVIERIKSLLPNLEEDERFEEYQRQGNGVWEVAEDRTMKAQSRNDFLGLDLGYKKAGRDFAEQIYAIGHGHLGHIGAHTQGYLFFLRKWAKTPELRRVQTTELGNITDFDVLSKTQKPQV